VALGRKEFEKGLADLVPRPFHDAPTGQYLDFVPSTVTRTSPELT
jgi:hypothetical protein